MITQVEKFAEANVVISIAGNKSDHDGKFNNTTVQ